MAVLGRGLTLFQRLGLTRALLLHHLHAAVQVLADAQHLPTHGFDALSRLLLGRLHLVADGQNRALDPVHPPFGLGGVHAAHHLGAVGLDLTAQRLG